MIFLQVDPVVVESMVKDLKNEWAILIGFFILTALQAFKIWIDYKNANRQSLDQAHRDITLTSIERYLKIGADKFTEEVTDLQLQSIVSSFVGHAQGIVNHEAGNIILNNNVMSNVSTTKKKISDIVFNSIKGVKLGLSRFKYHDRCMDTFVPDDFIDKTIEALIKIVVKERKEKTDYVETYRTLESYVERRFERLHQTIIQNAYNV